MMLSFASCESDANNTVVGASSATLPVAKVAAKFVLKPLTTVEFGNLVWISFAAEPSAGTTNSSNVSKLSGFVISMITFPVKASS